VRSEANTRLARRAKIGVYIAVRAIRTYENKFHCVAQTLQVLLEEYANACSSLLHDGTCMSCFSKATTSDSAVLKCPASRSQTISLIQQSNKIDGDDQLEVAYLPSLIGMLGRPAKKPMNLGRPAVVAYTPQLNIISSGQGNLRNPSSNYYIYRDL
jgi:hypothetical protein